MIGQVLAHRRLILTVSICLSLLGIAFWMTMERQEDPDVPNHWGQVLVPFPGAEAEMVERLVVAPIEQHLAEVDAINWVESTAYAEMAVLLVELRPETDDTTSAWDEVREAVADAALDLPSGVGQARVNDGIEQDRESVVLALTGSGDLLKLLAAARRLEKELLRVPQVAKVLLIGDPGEQVTIEIDDTDAARLGISSTAVAAQLSTRTRVIPGGSLALADKTVLLRPLTELQSLAEIAATPLTLPSGASIPLAEIGQVRLGQLEPAAARMRYNGEMCVGLSLVQRPRINLVEFGRGVHERLAEIAPSIAPIKINEVTFQPQRVARRLSDLSRSLLLGIFIVAGVVIFAMGARLGLVVASVVPLVTSASLACFAFGGGVLHQISIAALVLALGMLVDNAIVVAENVQWRVDRGQARHEAAIGAIRELATPLAAATATTIAAFLPMLLAKGPIAEFTRSIPVVIILTLSISYLFAISVTPILCSMTLKPGTVRFTKSTEQLGRFASGFAIRWPWLVLLVATVMVATSLYATRWVQQQFFPSSDRNQLTVELKLPEGAHLDATDRTARTMEQLLLRRPEVTKVASFVGRGTPKFYYNIIQVPWSPHVAQLIVETATSDDVEPLLRWIRATSEQFLLEAEVVPRKLEQGPIVRAPVEIRLYGEELEVLHAAATTLVKELRQIPGTTNVSHSIGPGAPNLRFRVDDAVAARYGLTRIDIARALLSQTRGLLVGQLRIAEDPIPIVVRSSRGEQQPAEDLAGLGVTSPDGRLIPLAQLVHLETAWRPAAIKHRDRQRFVTVSSQLEEGYTYSDVLKAIRPRLPAMGLPEGIGITIGGEAQGSDDANNALLKALPIGVVLLLAVLLAEFNSFRRMVVILVTVPLATAGIVPGLIIARQPFGFMSMLGVIALVGIVVNNAIVLLEVVEHRRGEGASIAEALADGVSQRIRPILLTTATTVAGLLPLAFSSSTLWPPLAWAMISGLLASTLLTLVVVPALYTVLFSPWRKLTVPPAGVSPAGVSQTALVLFALSAIAGTATSAMAAPEGARQLSLAESMALAGSRPAAQAAAARAHAAEQAAIGERRAAVLPVLTSQYTISDRDRALLLATPIGEFPFGDSRQLSATADLLQPLFDPSRILHTVPATREEASAARLASDRTRQELAAVAAAAHLAVLRLDAGEAATTAYITSLSARLTQVEEMVAAGRALHADALKLLLAKEQAEQELLALRQSRTWALAALAQAVGESSQVAALPVASMLSRPAPAVADAVAQALARRLDLQALAHSLSALEHRRKGVKAERLPRLDARLRWTWSDGSPYTNSSWLEGLVSVTWTPFAAATRGPRIAAAAAEQQARLAELEEARRLVAVTVTNAIAGIETAHGAALVAGRGIEQAEETVRVESERHLAGRATTNDLLEAEAQLRDRRTSKELAELAVVEAWVQLWLATGDDAYHPTPVIAAAAAASTAG